MSVCIRAFERPDELLAAIESALAQTYEGEFEVVVSDDSGRLGAVVEGLDDPRVRYVANSAPSGPPGNLRHAVGHARGDVLAMLNDDDWWEPRFLATCMAVLDADPRVDVAFTDYSLSVGGHLVRRRFPYAPGRHDAFVREVLDAGVPVSGTVMRRAAFEPPSDGVVGDFYISLAAARAGCAFHYVPEPLTVTRVHPGQNSWSEEGLPTRTIATLSAFDFSGFDEIAETMRRARLAEQHLAGAGRHARRGRLSEARSDISRARGAAAGGSSLSPVRAALALSGVRGLVMRTAPPTLIAWALEHWPRWRPSVTRATAGQLSPCSKA